MIYKPLKQTWDSQQQISLFFNLFQYIIILVIFALSYLYFEYMVTTSNTSKDNYAFFNFGWSSKHMNMRHLSWCNIVLWCAACNLIGFVDQSYLKTDSYFVWKMSLRATSATYRVSHTILWLHFTSTRHQGSCGDVFVRAFMKEKRQWKVNRKVNHFTFVHSMEIAFISL